MTTNDLDGNQVSKGCVCVGSRRSCADSVVFSYDNVFCFLIEQFLGVALLRAENNHLLRNIERMAEKERVGDNLI